VLDVLITVMTSRVRYK